MRFFAFRKHLGLNSLEIFRIVQKFTSFLRNVAKMLYFP